MSYSVQQRAHEIGIRVALGADTGRVRQMVIRQGMSLAFLGVILGIGLALGLTRFLASFLYGVSPRDWIVFMSVPIILNIVAFVAVLLPAVRATRVDPMIVLRSE